MVSIASIAPYLQPFSVIRSASRYESHPLRQIRPFVFNNLARRSGFYWAMAGNAAENRSRSSLNSPRKPAQFGHAGSLDGHVGVSGTLVPSARQACQGKGRSDSSDASAILPQAHSGRCRVRGKDCVRLNELTHFESRDSFLPE